MPAPGAARDRARAVTEADSPRRELARYLDYTAFPPDRLAARDVMAPHAPDPVLKEARSLPHSGSHANVPEIVDALGTGQRTG